MIERTRLGKVTLRRFTLLIVLFALFLTLWNRTTLAPARAAGTISLTALDVAYTQNFDTLAMSGTSSAVPTGWDFVESGSNANNTYTANNGSSNAGDTYSYGATGSTERAFGSLQSSTLIPTIGASFTNNTGTTITTLRIEYTGE
ncbi:MAG: PEP-CTERM sorting domain-containing protein, partial [Anaerolineae bacterium]|nr:PEP-CTERM sorting domain-containing protein [Anaerolineae bacterium]